MSSYLETRLRAELDARAGTAPAAPALGEVIDKCERDLTRHRRRLATAAVGAVAAGVAVTVPFLLNGAADDSLVANNGPVSDAALIEACRNGSQPTYWTNLIFGSGAPRISAQSHANAPRTSTVVVSADGAYWADCGNAENTSANTPGALDDAPGRTHMTVYETAQSQIAPFSAGASCPKRAADIECDTFIIDYVDRLPDAVAQLEFTTIDGETTRLDVNEDGFVVFDYEGTIPAQQRERELVHWIAQITYLDADGNSLASNRWSGTNRSPESDQGLPPLTAYPSLARQVQDVIAPTGGSSEG